MAANHEHQQLSCQKQWDLLCLRTDSMMELILHLKKHGKGTKYQRCWTTNSLQECVEEISTPERQALSQREVSEEIIKLQNDQNYKEQLTKLKTKWMTFYPYVFPPVGTIQYAQMLALCKLENDLSEQ